MANVPLLTLQGSAADSDLVAAVNGAGGKGKFTAEVFNEE